MKENKYVDVCTADIQVHAKFSLDGMYKPLWSVLLLLLLLLLLHEEADSNGILTTVSETK